MKQIRTRRLMAATVIGTIATLTFVTGAYAEPVNPETLMAERTNPAVQLIETEFTATVSSRPITFNKNGSDLFYRAVYKWDIGELRSASDVVGYMFDRIASDPTYYLREVGEARTKTLRDIYSGSGFVASPDGYVVTAKHVVTSQAEVTKGFADQGAAWFAKADAKAFIDIFKKYDLSTEAVKNIVAAVSAFDAEKLKVHVGTPTVSVILGTSSADGSRIGKAYPAEVVYRSSSTLGEDVAVLRIHAEGQLPSLTLASDAAVQGDTIYINGFPALPDDSEAALLQPTLTDGQITAIKPNRAGLQLLQHNATASPGASGAPAINETAEVIGILISGAHDPNGGSLGENYVMPLDSVRAALARSGTTPTPGQTTIVYNQALDDFYADHYTKALDEFRQVKDLFPAHAYAGGYISRAQLAISQGKDVPVVPPRKPVPWMLILIAGGALLVAVCIGAFVGYRLSRRGRDRIPVQVVGKSLESEPNQYTSADKIH